MKKRAINDRFWAHFSQRYWEKKAACFKGLTSPLFTIDSDSLFALILRYSEKCEGSRTTHGIKLYLDGHKQYPDEVLALLPVPSDRSLLGYHRRMSALFEDYCLVCDELLQVTGAERGVLDSFMLGLYRQVGFPAKFAELGLYLGNYRTTPFGVHRDGCGVFSIPVKGTKRFRLWKPDFVEKTPQLQRAHRYADYLKYSTLMVARPGDIAYWPSTAWHVAESRGAFSATWSIGVWLDETVGERVSPETGTRLPNRIRSARTIPFDDLYTRIRRERQDEKRIKLPRFLKFRKSELKKPHGRNDQLALGRYWTKIVSKAGFRS